MLSRYEAEGWTYCMTSNCVQVWYWPRRLEASYPVNTELKAGRPV